MKDLLLTTLENSRNYTLAVAEAMPSKFYDSKPTETVWSFRELLHHIAYGIEWWNDNNIKKIKTDWSPPATEKDKTNVINYINRAYDALRATVEKIKINNATVLGFLSTIDHITHHRGQAVTYLRCNGISAPEYSY
ncbi:MAG: DinB family protein [Bacteroidetes bacterium]|nr:DinB family protein [Bacteroidota bacterium]